VAEVLLAEVGADIKPFPSEQHLASRARMCPGNEESADKRRRRRITPGNRWLSRPWHKRLGRRVTRKTAISLLSTVVSRGTAGKSAL